MAGKITKEQRLQLESKIKDALSKLTGDLAGTYTSLCEMSDAEKKDLIEDHILYHDATSR